MRKQKPRTEAPVNGGRNYDGPKVAKLPIRAAGKSRYCVYCTRTANRHR